MLLKTAICLLLNKKKVWVTTLKCVCLYVFFLDKGHTDTDRLHACQIDISIENEYARRQYLILGHYIFNFLGGRLMNSLSSHAYDISSF